MDSTRSSLGYTVNAFGRRSVRADYFIRGDKIDLITIVGTHLKPPAANRSESLPVRDESGGLVPSNSIADISCRAVRNKINHR